MSAGSIGEPANNKENDMTVQFNLRSTTGALQTGPNPGRTTDESVASRWTRLAAMAVLAVAVLAGALTLRGSSPTHKANTAPLVAASARHEPLIVPEEQLFIDARRGRVVQVASLVPVVASGVQPLIVPEEPAFIDATVAGGSAVDAIDWCATHRPC
jgi:anti-sigma-K factor RskA